MQHMKEHGIQRHGRGSLHRALCSGAPAVVLLLVAACGGGGGDPAPNTPLTTPMAMVVNQDDTTMTTIRLDGRGSPVIDTLSLGPTQPDAIGGVAVSLGEWIFVTHTGGNCVWTIDPISALTPFREECLAQTGKHRVGERPRRIARDSVEKDLLWTLSEGDPASGIDTVRGCDTQLPGFGGGSVAVLRNAHINVGGAKPTVAKADCLFGKGEQFIAFSRPTADKPTLLRRAFISSRTTGLVTVVRADPTDGQGRFAAWVPINLCDSAKEIALGRSACDSNPFAQNQSAPAGMFWSPATGMIYSYLSGYNAIVEIDPDPLPGEQFITRRVNLTLPPPSTDAFHSVGITPDGRFLFLVGEDILSDLIASAPSGNVCQSDPKVYGRLAVVDLAAPTLSVRAFPVPDLENVRPAHFQFAQDGRRLYLTQSNKVNDLPCATQAHNLKLDKLLVFDPATFLAAPTFVAEIDLPAVGSNGLHGMDLWITGPAGAGSAKGMVVTNATPGINGTVSLIDASTNTITATIPVGRNPKQVTVYYYGLAASDNQATPIW